MIEEITDVLERGDPPDGDLKVSLSMIDDEVVVDANAPRAPSTDDWFPPDADLSPKEQLANTVRERRIDRVKSGLGRFNLAANDVSKKKPPGSSGGMSGAPALVEFVPLRKKS